MNTPKEIAIELVDKFYSKISGVPINVISKMIMTFNSDSHFKTAKECALIAVDEILKILDAELGDPVEHWQQVIQEINKL